MGASEKKKPKRTAPQVWRQRKVVGLALHVSDLHTLGTTALMPEGFITAEGVKLGQNRLQAYLTGCWANMCDEVKALKARTGARLWVNINGDATEGNHHNTRQIAAIEEDDHAQAGAELIDPLMDLADVGTMVQGTGAHVQQLGALERRIAMTLRNKDKLHRPDGGWIWPRLRYEFMGIRFQCAHHISGGQTSMARNRSVTNKVFEHYHDSALHGETPAHYLVYSHIHSFADSGLQYGKTRGLITGCWQFPTEFGHKIGPFRETQFGGWLIHIYDDGTTDAVKVEYPVMRETREYTKWQGESK